MGITANALYRCDCLALLERLNSDQFTLAYLDPPWLTGQTNGWVFSGTTDAERLKDYLEFMAKVYQQVQRTLTSRGVFLLHADRSSLGHQRLILDQIFGRSNFQHEFVIPQRRISGPRRGPGHETLLMYSKSEEFFYAPPTRPLTKEEIAHSFPQIDDHGRYILTDMTGPAAARSRVFEWNGVLPPSGRAWRYSRRQMEELEREGRLVTSAATNTPRLKRYVDEAAEVDVGDIWSDLPAMPMGKERTGWAGQRPTALLDRILRMASEEGDVILDPFCGSGTSLERAQALGRRWIGCDISEEAIPITIQRLEQRSGVVANVDFAVGDQADLEQSVPRVHTAYLVIATDLDRPQALEFVLDEPLPIEETRHYEFKEVKAQNPARSIQDVAERYAIAFLNSEGGRIFWGVRDSDRKVVGVRLDSQQRDEIARVVTGKLNGITPAISPTHCRLAFHPVRGPQGVLPNLVVVELTVPRVSPQEFYFPQGQGLETWIRTDSGTKRLTGPELVQEIRKRMSQERLPQSPA